MHDSHVTRGVHQQLAQLDSAGVAYATELVELVLTAAQRTGSSDVHFQPTPEGLEILWRLDGVLQPLGVFPRGEQTDPVTRLKVLAGLLTYRRDSPQEGRIRDTPPNVEMRVSTLPTLHGERAVVRLLMANARPWFLADLGFPAAVQTRWHELLHETSGMLIVTGPAGSGKTTTAYACLRQIVADSRGARSILTLEDPIEASVTGVAQSQVNEPAGYTLTTGLRSLLRQDPEVIMVGEIRDPETAEMAFQAALTGQLIITTFHAGSTAEAISRLSDMGIEPYLLRSGIRGVLGQRLVRRLCTCKRSSDDPAAHMGLSVTRSWVPEGCPECHFTGYRERSVLAELLLLDAPELGRALLERQDRGVIESIAVAGGMQTRWDRAREVVEQGVTCAAEVRRVLGFP
jgi:type II secretory ATPase GspE/PulE/Tfp pilus assembly ATPase PilB-like protein